MARVAVVTGGTRGIGEAISVGLKDAGYKVAAVYAGNDEKAREFSERTGIAGVQVGRQRLRGLQGRASPRSRRNWVRSRSSSTTPASPATACSTA